jgi:hypothetical protein
VTNLTTTKININVVHVLKFASSAQNPCILRKQKIKYIVKIVTDTALTKIVLITTMMFARMFINAKLAIRLR